MKTKKFIQKIMSKIVIKKTDEAKVKEALNQGKRAFEVGLGMDACPYHPLKARELQVAWVTGFQMNFHANGKVK